MFCPKCGTEIPDDSLFCAHCGSTLRQENAAGEGVRQDDAPAQSADATTTGPKRVKQPVATSAADKANAGQMATARELNAAEAAHRKRGIIVIAAAALVVIAAAIAVYLVLFAPYKVDERTFPDPVLRNAVSLQCDTDADGSITRDQAKALTSLDLSSSGIASLEGIDKFPNLDTLNLSGCKSLQSASSLNLPALTTLDVSNSGVIELDVKSLAGLQSLNASGTGIAALDVSDNGRLSSLSIDDSVAVTGIDSTMLREEWVVSNYARSGFGGEVDGFPTGSNEYQNEDTTFEYDGKARLVSYTSEGWYDDKGKSMVTKQSYAYDEDGNKAIMTLSYGSSNNTELTLSLNDSSQIVSELIEYKSSSTSSTNGLTYAYNEMNMMTSRSDPSSTSYEYAYNDNGQLTQVTTIYKTSTSTTRSLDALIEYDDVGLITKLDMARGAYEFEYDAEGRCVSRTKYWKSYGGSDYMMLSLGTDWTSADDVSYVSPTYVTYAYDDSGKIVSASSSTENTWYAGQSLTGEANAELFYDEGGKVVGRAYHSSNTSNGSTLNYDCSESLAYTRVFVSKDAASTLSALTIDDPLCKARFHDFRGRYYRFLDGQQDLVRNIVIASCLYGFM